MSYQELIKEYIYIYPFIGTRFPQLSSSSSSSYILLSSSLKLIYSRIFLFQLLNRRIWSCCFRSLEEELGGWTMIKVSLFDTSLIFWPWLMTTISHTRQRGWVEEMQPLGKSNPWLSHTFFFILCFVSFQNKVMSLRSVTSRQFMVLGSISFILLCFVLIFFYPFGFKEDRQR